jgi:HEAT repeat protein
LGKASEEVVAGLLGLAADGSVDASVQRAAASALGQLGEVEKAIELLLGLAADGSVDASVWRAAASALGQLGEASEEVVAGLLELLRLEEVPASREFLGAPFDWKDLLKNAAYGSLQRLISPETEADDG